MCRSLSRHSDRFDNWNNRFRLRFSYLLSCESLRQIPVRMACALLAKKSTNEDDESEKFGLNKKEYQRLSAYCSNNTLSSYTSVLDLIVKMATFYFGCSDQHGPKLSGLQTSFLIGMGLEGKTMDDVRNELDPQSKRLTPETSLGIVKIICEKFIKNSVVK
ncbi:hypothetical protein ACOME3_000413 [Neoechinorhynchus agilis]